MLFPEDRDVGLLHELATKVYYAIKYSKVKWILVCSDVKGEGKTIFLLSVLPVLNQVFDMNICILDVSYDSEKSSKSIQTHMSHMSYMSEKPLQKEFSKRSSQIDYITSNEFFDVELIKDPEKKKLLFPEFAKKYDAIFVNTNTLRRAYNTKLPFVDVDGAIIIRSSKSIAKKNLPITDLLLDRRIPILGIVNNEAI